MALEDLAAIRELRRREHRLFENIPRARSAKRALFYTMDPWQLGVVEQFLHLACLRKGHEPKTVYYDGLLPICGWENHQVAPPAPSVLQKRFAYVFDCFGIEATGISQYLDKTAATMIAQRILDDVSDSDLATLTYRGIAVGSICLRDLFQYTLGHFEPATRDNYALFRKHLLHGLMSIDLAYAILEKDRPNVVVLVNGKLVMYSYMYEVCRHLRVPVTTWEEGMYFDTSIVLANDDRAIDFPVESNVWDQFKTQPLTCAESDGVDRYFASWRQQTATAYRYYEKEERDFERMRRALDINPDSELFSIFTNIVWDTNALGKDVAFGSMMDWVFSTIDLIGGIPDAVLVIRAHPGESKWQFKTRTPVRQLVMQRYGGQLPRHVRIVDGDSEFSSYEIARHSESCAVYTSTLGIELTLMGLQPLVCGRPFYSGRGFTNDITTREEYAAAMSGKRAARAGNPELLRKFMHLVLHRLVKRPEFLVGIHDTPQTPKVRIHTFEGFPESMPAFARIVDCILERRSFIDGVASNASTAIESPAAAARSSDIPQFIPGEDASGRLFIEKGELFRGLRGPHVDFYRDLLTGSQPARLEQAGLIETQLTDRRLSGYEAVVRHQRLWPVTFPFEWPAEQFKASAIFFCEFSRKLMEMGVGLKDAHGYNILFDRSHQPRFIDFCSLVPLSETGGRVHPEFNRYFLNPLYLMHAGQYADARHLVNLGGYETGSRRGGVDDEKLLSHLSETVLHRFNEYRQRERSLRKSGAFTQLLELYKQELAEIDVSVKSSCWSTYYDVSGLYPTNSRFASFTPTKGWQPKQHHLRELFDSSESQTVLDIGCSAGWFSKLAASCGHNVIAMDCDEAAISRLYRESVDQSLAISPIYCEFSQMTTICLEDTPKAIERFRCDIVLACALIHHLVFKAGMSIREVVETLAKVTERTLIIEFLDEADQSIQQFRHDARDVEYSADLLSGELRRHFKDLQQVDSTGNRHRTLFICRDKIERADVRSASCMYSSEPLAVR